MLVTTCKNCGARFRVTPEQLNLRQGQVRCGQCEEVFNGFESLERFPGDDTGARLLAVRAAKGTHPGPAAELANLDLGQRARPGSPAPQPSQRLPAPPATVDLRDIPDLPDVLDLPLEPHAVVEPVAKGPAPDKPTPVAPTPLSRIPDLSPEPSSPPPQARPSRAWAFGAVFLSLLLALQLAYAFRAPLARQYPVLRPYLESACATAGCTVPWINEEAALKLEDSELLEVPGKPGQIALQARIRNLAPSAQEFPHLELTLTDVTGQTAVRRVLRPADYLGRAPAVGEVMAPGSEALLSVRLETGRIRPTGYELLLFYP
ncbi:MAG: zinc-ribbon domain-containing protein [Betaproteobacteria bacterium]|nr:zinc-ribbon domain-containing protein [Betaproteobacteria bacterium]